MEKWVRGKIESTWVTEVRKKIRKKEQGGKKEREKENMKKT